MQHPDHDDLALIALGEGLGDAVDAHVDGCAQCSAEVESFRLTVGLADLSNFGEDAARPGEHVWQAIATELGFSETQRPAAGIATAYDDSRHLGFPRQPAPPLNNGADHGTGLDHASTLHDGALDPRSTLDHGALDEPPRDHRTGAPDRPDGRPAGLPGDQFASRELAGTPDDGANAVQRLYAVPGNGTPPAAGSARSGGSNSRRWTRWATPLAAAVIGVAVGAGAVAISQNRADEVTVQATAPLTPVPGGPLAADQQQQLGKAEIVTAADGQQVRVQAADLPATSNDYEVWLFGDGGKMVSLGTLDNGSGTFTVPQGISTQEYRVIDVSDEPPDGVPTHSGISMIRGQFS